MTSYLYNPHRHIKIWLSNNPDEFMNLENQIRLSDMCEKNPQDTIHLIYDSNLLKSESVEKLQHYCAENKVIPIDVNTLKNQLKSDNERQLFEFYQDEIQHLKEGGNLAVASDILRWISAVYCLGTYTDFDYPVETSTLPPLIEVNAPLILNIGSLKMGKKEFILTNNDFIAIVDEKAAKIQIEQIQLGIIKKLNHYDADFVEKSMEALGDSFINRCIAKLFLKNRSEAIYMTRSKKLNRIHRSSRKIRNHIKQVMSDKNAFIEFNRQVHENDSER